jgi:hypothetical protein
MNRTGRAGRGGVNAETIVAFLDYYTYPDEDTRRKRINGHLLSAAQVRQIRRWRNGHTTHVNPAAWLRFLHELEFNLPWFHTWCKQHNRKVT